MTGKERLINVICSIIGVLIAILFLVYFFYQSYTTYQALNLIKDQQIIYEKQGTIEETK